MLAVLSFSASNFVRYGATKHSISCIGLRANPCRSWLSTANTVRYPQDSCAHAYRAFWKGWAHRSQYTKSVICWVSSTTQYRVAPRTTHAVRSKRSTTAPDICMQPVELNWGVWLPYDHLAVKARRKLPVSLPVCKFNTTIAC